MSILPDDDFLDTEFFVPKQINKTLSGTLFADLPDSVRAVIKERVASGWRFYIVDQNRGRCYYNSKTITIPAWAIRRGIEYKTWYVCHEVAHTTTRGDGHGSLFMAELKRICPANCIYFELGYKPRNAAAAGIRKPRAISAANAEGAL